MRYLSVCSGIEAATVAWHPLGWTPAAFSEIDAFPRAVLAHHYPHVPLHGDFTTIKGHEYGAVDLLVGGTPCQSFSVAGLRKGLDDPRGNLMLEYGALAKRLGAKWLVWENVPGVLSSNGGGDFGSFLGMLVELGYGFAYRVLDAQYFGVPQRRRRVFVVACLGDWRAAAAVLFERYSLQGNPTPRREAGQNIAGTISSRTTGGGGLGTDFELGGGLQPVGLIAGGQVARCLTTKTRIDAETETLIPTFGGDFSYAVDVCPTLRAGGNLTGGDRPPGTDADTADSLIVAFDSRQDCVSSTDVFGALGSSSPQAQAVSYAIQAGALRTNPNSGPDGVGVQESIAYTLEARAEVQAVCVTGDITHTLKAEGFDASEDGTGRGQPIVAAFQSSQSGVRLVETHATLDANNGPRRRNGALIGMAVRRLTPRECERLQGFPDDFTMVPIKKAKRRSAHYDYTVINGQLWQLAADGPRYKALGNSMAVPCMRWLGERIQAVVDIQSQLEAA